MHEGQSLKKYIVLRSLIAFAAIAASVSCSHVGLKYTGDYQSELSGPGQIVVEKSYPVRWLAVLCGGTFWAYGGACWGYVLFPTDSMINEVKEKALSSLGAQVPDFKLSEEKLDPYQWKFMYENARLITGINYENLKTQELSLGKTIDESSTKLKNDPKFDIKSFEDSIVTKPKSSDLLYSESDAFPNGWPEQWYFESPQYRYWTIVGDIKDNPSTAMASSAAKIQEVLSKEFPQRNYKAIPPFETTHNHVKKIRGRYQSWRIVRVQHNDVTKMAQ